MRKSIERSIKKALEIRERHKRLREESGISEQLLTAVKALSHPDAYKKHFKKTPSELEHERNVRVLRNAILSLKPHHIKIRE